MKKTLKILFLIVIAISITACGEKNNEKKPEKKNSDNNPKTEEVFYETLPSPSDKIDHVDKNEKTDTKTEYIMYVNEYSYNDFYNYITKLEELGFHYDFYKECVPKEESKLIDKTETSWSANNGKIWIRASWRSNENQYYTDYNLQIIFNNYDYLLPLKPTDSQPSEAEAPANNGTEEQTNN